MNYDDQKTEGIFYFAEVPVYSNFATKFMIELDATRGNRQNPNLPLSNLPRDRDLVALKLNDADARWQNPEGAFGRHGMRRWGNYFQLSPTRSLAHWVVNIYYDPPKDFEAWSITKFNQVGVNEYTSLEPEVFAKFNNALELEGNGTIELPLTGVNTSYTSGIHGTKFLFLNKQQKEKMRAAGSRNRLQYLDSANNWQPGEARVAGALSRRLRWWFLVKRKVHAYFPDDQEFREIYWYQLATNSKVEDHHNCNIYSKTNYPSRRTDYFSRYTTTRAHIAIGRNDKKFKTEGPETYDAPAASAALKAMGEEQRFSNSRLGQQVRAIRAKKDKIVAELERTRAVVGPNSKLLAQCNRDIATIDTQIAKLKRSRGQLKVESGQLAAQIARNTRTWHKNSNAMKVIEKKLAKKEQEFIDYREANGINAVDYEAGLLKSGIRITDMIYRLDGRKVMASKEPNVVLNDKAKLFKIKMQTTRPIKIWMGLALGEPARASGPHDIEVESSPYIRMSIRALYPWSVVGWDKFNKRFKCYPHVAWQSANTGSHARYAEDLSVWSDVCMGELQDSVARAFRANSPRTIALAVLSFLQSVNVEDSWGESYVYFPTWDSIHNYSADSNKPKVFEIVSNGTKFMAASPRGSSWLISWGDHVLGNITSFSSELVGNYSFGHVNWVNKNGGISGQADAVPSWHWSDPATEIVPVPAPTPVVAVPSTITPEDFALEA